MSLAGAILAPADSLRSAILRVASPWVSPLFADRSRRVWWLGVFSVVSAFVVAGVVPLWSLALGPVLLGVPHLVSDVRYLVVRPKLHHKPWLLVLVGAPLLATSLGAGPEVGVLAMVPAVFGAGFSWRLVVVALVWLALTAAAYLEPFGFQLAFVHAHNVVAVVLWWSLTSRTKAMAVIPLLTIGGALAILAGALDPVVTFCSGWTAPSTGTSFTEFVETITPDVDPTLAGRLVLSFCYLQSVHYAVWLRLVPDDARPRPAPRTFAASWHALVADFGLAPLLVFVALSLGLAVWGAFTLSGARLGYLQLAAFHGYLELAIAARWFVHGRVSA